MTDVPAAPRIYHVDRLDLTFSPWSWPFARERRPEIDAFFAEQMRQKPSMWNGRVLLVHRYDVSDGAFRGECFETDYASFAAWGHWGWPVNDVRDCFGAAAVVCADGAFLLGEMGPQTFHAGEIYFPCGVPDPRDIHDGKLDIDFSVGRELKEETGLDIATFEPEPGWTVVEHGALIALIKVLRSRENAVSLRERILAFNASESEPELADIRIARGPADFQSAFRPFVKAFLAHRFAGG